MTPKSVVLNHGVLVFDPLILVLVLPWTSVCLDWTRGRSTEFLCYKI